MPRSVPLFVAAVLTALVATGCRGGQAAGPGTGCAPAFQEGLDSRSTVHLFPGATEPRYRTDPPTSGPHRLGPPYQGVLTAPIPRPSQVAMLESGYVILQSQDLPADQAATLNALSGRLVTVAPPVAALPARVVATAWTWKLECSSVSAPALAAIRAFVADHRGVGFIGNIPATTPTT